MTNENLSFAKAEVVRLMKQYLDDDKMIREQVKIGMNNFFSRNSRKRMPRIKQISI